MTARRAVTLIGVFAAVLALCGCQRNTTEPASPVVVDKWTSFTSPYFSFPYPANWTAIDEGDSQGSAERNMRSLLRVDGTAVLWVGGVAGCSRPGRCSSSDTAAIFAMVARVPGYPGPMSDQQFSQRASDIEDASRQTFGPGLRAVDRLFVHSFRAIAITALIPNSGEAGRFYVIFVKPDHLYDVYCTASQRLFDSYAEVFENAIRHMEVRTG